MASKKQNEKNELSLVIREDGSFVNDQTGEELTLRQVIAEARTRREAANASKKAERDAKKAERNAKRLERAKARAEKAQAELEKATKAQAA